MSPIRLPFWFVFQADREGYIAIIMPKPDDWLKAKSLLVGADEYKKLRELF